MSAMAGQGAARARIFGAAVTVIVVGCLLVAAEATVRILDGYPLTRLALPAPALPPSAAALSAERDLADRPYVAKVPLAPGVASDWYLRNPPPLPQRPTGPDVERRFARYVTTDPYGAFYVWNREYVHSQLCKGSTMGSLGILDDFYVFDAPTRTQYPIFRHPSNSQPPTWFPTNRFGWRGPDLTLNKPADTIRIAFAGSSMTIDPYEVPFSNVEYVGAWLNLWAKARGYPYRIEMINAARSGVDSASVEAVVVQELAPLEPDLVIFDGANDFKPGLLLRVPAKAVAPRQPQPVTPRPSERYLALARRLRAVALGRTEGVEPPKTLAPLDWPGNVDEFHPNVTQPLPMQLDEVVAHLDAMRQTLARTGGTLSLSSEVLMVYDGLRLQIPRDQSVFTFLNTVYSPLTYAQARRLMDFENRVLQMYASTYRLPYFDKAATFPLDPLLFTDALHMTTAGSRLKAWILLQSIAEWLDAEIANGRLPHPMQHPQDTHPAFPSVEYPLVSRATLTADCH